MHQQRSDAKSVLLCHHDIQDLLQVRLCTRPNSSLTLLVQGGEEELRRLLSESRVVVNVEIDENGGKSGSRVASSKAFILDSCETGQPRSNRTFKSDQLGFQYCCKCSYTLKGVH